MKRSAASMVLAVIAALLLAYDAKVHLHLAHNYDSVGDGLITQGRLFRLEGVVAIIAAIAVLVSDSRLAWAFAGLTGLAGVAAVLLYRYVDVGAIGPIPNMYEPIWYAEKTRSAWAEGLVVVVWLIRELLRMLSARSAAGSPAQPAPDAPPS